MAPTKEAVLGGHAPVDGSEHLVAPRQVVARTPPPPRPLSFEQQRPLLEKSNGVPLSPADADESAGPLVPHRQPGAYSLPEITRRLRRINLAGINRLGMEWPWKTTSDQSAGRTSDASADASADASKRKSEERFAVGEPERQSGEDAAASGTAAFGMDE